MGAVFTDPQDLIDAVLEKVNPHAVRVPTMEEQLTALLRPGRAVAFRTESGSLYEVNLYSEPAKTRLVKHDGDEVTPTATGTLLVARDPDRGVCGIVVVEDGGRHVKTSAITKVWLSFDATIEGPGAFFREPFAPCPVVVRGKACGKWVGANGACSEAH